LATHGIAAPRLTAEVLLAHATGQRREWLYAHATDELIELWWIHFGRYLHERMAGRPTQYITGHQEFYGRDFRVTPAVLIPRPETEHLVEAALERLRPGARVVDAGTGSGCIAVTLALEARTRVVAVDLSRDALDVARHNALRLDAPVDFLQADLLTALGGPLDLLVSNPPYVAESSRATLAPEVVAHEPLLALFAGSNGLEFYRRLAADAPRVLAPDGWLLMELGAGQAEAVGELLSAWRDVEFRPDLAGHLRVALARPPRR
jgi:release factor glutamine methyltransferase